MRLVASLIVALSLAACHKSKATGPAWPEPSKTADDGGESIEPRTSVAASLEKSTEPEPEEDKDDAPVVETSLKPVTTEPEKPATLTPPTQPKDDDVIMSEEIIIEIED